jgi:hypothetical protein
VLRNFIHALRRLHRDPLEQALGGRRDRTDAREQLPPSAPSEVT